MYTSREIWVLFPLLLCKAWCVQIIEWIKVWRSHLFVCEWLYLIIIIIQVYMKASDMWKCVYVSYLIKSEVWTISQCLWLGHEPMVCAVCFAILLCPNMSSYMLKKPWTLETHYGCILVKVIATLYVVFDPSSALIFSCYALNHVVLNNNMWGNSTA